VLSVVVLTGGAAGQDPPAAAEAQPAAAEPAAGADGGTGEPGGQAADDAAAPAAAPPLPFHCIEGYAGGAITPMAYLCNGEKHGGCPDWFGLPSVAYSFVNLGSKELHVVSVTQTFLKRFEFGYAYNNLDAGSLYEDVAKAGLDMGERHVGLHHFNLRALLLPENSFDLPTPAVTAGLHFKYNDAMDDIDENLGGAFTAIGYDDDCGVDYTLTATKMFPELAFGRPVIVTAGLRLSRASQLGLLGFANRCRASFECSVACLPLDQLCLAYELRTKSNPYDEIAGLVEDEDSWHAFSASWIVDEHLTLTGVLGVFGNVANASEDCVMGLQVKYEF
jgi:hypothetical protein